MLAAGVEAALDQVHHQEREIVEHVAGRDQRVELDRVEQRRPSFDQHDVAEMKVAVAAPHQAELTALLEQRADARKAARLA